jgi:hypothetical protein
MVGFIFHGFGAAIFYRHQYKRGRLAFLFIDRILRRGSNCRSVIAVVAITASDQGIARSANGSSPSYGGFCHADSFEVRAGTDAQWGLPASGEHGWY